MIKNQTQINKLKHFELDNRSSTMIRIDGIRHLFVKVQKSTKSLSVSYIFRQSIGNKNKCISLGTIKDISLKEAKSIARRLNNQIREQRIPRLESRMSSSNITILELYNLYTKSRNLKASSEKSYRTVIFNYCKKILNSPISEIKPENLDQDLSVNTLKQYTNILNIIFSWGINRKIIDYNPFEGLCATYNNIHIEHRKALACENFDTINIAKNAIKDFLQAILRKGNNTLFLVWVIHLILGTRVTETYRVLSTYQEPNDYVTIEVKSTKKGAEPNFRVPISKDIRNLIIYLQTYIKSMSPVYFPKYLNRSIPPEYKGKMSVHGSRSIFRTVIELLNPKNINSEAKEFYLAHNPLTTVQAAYNRTDYLKERKQLQEIYTKWLTTCLTSEGIAIFTEASS